MEEWLRFLDFAVFSAIACAIYDGIRIFRRIFPHGILWISLEDLLYWSVTAFYFFLKLCQSNNGILRGYILLGLAVGALLYYGLCGRFLIRFVSQMIIALKKRLKKVREMATIKRKELQRKAEKKKAGKKHESE